MSFLTRTLPTIRSQASARLFSTSAVYRKTATETVKDAVKAVDRTVSDAAVGGIDAGVAAKNAVKSAAGMEANKASGEANKLAGQAQGEAAKLKGQAQGKVEEVKGKL